MNQPSYPSVETDANPVEVALALQYLELGCRVHRGYLYPDDLPGDGLPTGCRIKITVETEYEGVNYHDATQE